MKLQLLIPQYKETEDVIKNMLESIEVQQSVPMSEVGVIICNDGSDVKLSKEFLDKFSYEIKYFAEPHRGVSGTRNACLDHATADYVMFCDADDMFLTVCGLYIIFREIQMGGFDVMVSLFVEESKHPKTSEILYLNHPMDSTFVHGKVYRRKFLLENDVRWNDDLTIHEDSYFNCLAQKMTKEVKYCQTAFYLWKWRDESVCRHDPKYILKTYNNMLESNTCLVNELLRRKKKDEATFYATSMIMDAYYTMNKKEWVNELNADYRLRTERRFKKYYLDFKELFEGIKEEQKAQIIMGIKNRMMQEGQLLETITFNDWIKHVLELE